MKNLKVIIFFISLINTGVCLASTGLTVTLPGDPGSVVNADIDGDGIQDIAVVIAKEDFTRSILVLWGDKQSKFNSTSEISMNLKFEEIGLRPSMRDTTSRSIVVGDFNGDGKVDIGTSAGLAINNGNRQFSWTDLKNKTQSRSQPVGFLKMNGKNILVVRIDGGVDACNSITCSNLIRSDFLKDGLHTPSEMIIFDFDNDGKLDILAGSEFLDSQNSYVWLGRDNFKKAPLKLEGVAPIDIQIADINGDKRLDLFSQVKEFISDFPSQTNVFLNKPDGLELLKTFVNFDNHNDNATLTKKANGCFDYFQIGVDRGFGKLSMETNGSGSCGFAVENGQTESTPRFERISDVTGTGIQCLPIRGNKCSLIVRRPLTSQDKGSLWIEDYSVQ